jgi:hypothetical protein
MNKKGAEMIALDFKSVPENRKVLNLFGLLTGDRSSFISTLIPREMRRRFPYRSTSFGKEMR